VGLLVAIGIFRSSGVLDLFCGVFSPLTNILNIPDTIIPLALVKMFSSSAATGMVLDVFRTYGPDSLAGNMVSIMMSSTETIFYTISVYCLAVGVTKTRWTLAGALLASIVGIACSILLAMYM
ncbi:MAG: nucleoside recognition domain-containing protein, partial [Wujia sp.]